MITKVELKPAPLPADVRDVADDGLKYAIVGAISGDVYALFAIKSSAQRFIDREGADCLEIREVA